MRYLPIIVISFFLSVINSVYANDNDDACRPSTGLAVQVLGSGGPIADDGRASSGYIVWINGRSRVMVDAGGGSFLRFAEAAVRFEDLSLIALSHLHADHSADLPAILKSGFFSTRTDSLAISGPDGAGPYPATDSYLSRLLDKDNGAYAYLSGYLDGSNGLVKLNTTVIDRRVDAPQPVYDDPDSDLQIEAIGVPHGPVPALAYRVRVGDKLVVFSGDQNGSSQAFIDFARGADVLLMHMPVPEGVTGVGRKLHAPPSVIADIASKTGAGKLILSHFMARSLDTLQANLDIIKSGYSGPVMVSHDLMCIEI